MFERGAVGVRAVATTVASFVGASSIGLRLALPPARHLKTAFVSGVVFVLFLGEGLGRLGLALMNLSPEAIRVCPERGRIDVHEARAGTAFSRALGLDVGFERLVVLLLQSSRRIPGLDV